MTIKLAIIMDDIRFTNKKKDSSLAMIEAAQRRNIEIYYMQIEDLFFANNQAQALTKLIKLDNNLDAIFEKTQIINLNDLDIILMRKDPPFDSTYLYATHLLDKAKQEGVLVVNNPQALRDYNEKIFATEFSQFTPKTIIAQNTEILKDFAYQEEEVIFKPLDGMGGTNIFKYTKGEPNLNVIIEVLTKNNTQQIMAQKYLPKIVDGDKRVLIVCGEVIPYCLARIPQNGETRGNLAAGGKGVAQPLSDRDFEIANTIAPYLLEKEIYFAGLDIIGDNLTEINITSPTCIREIDSAYNTDIAGKLIDKLVAMKNNNQ